ncbi:putative U4/U6.U5 tri-snRNP-associated protein 2 [Plasmodium gaboni]|uniref:Putative U4/U6.U5 tri-snRNP-associated protein 2 n=1 Tax=Plasmodium gaboni TaxID=647221 RepID=A0A151LDF4_9APIC|nr:putative U4/U6.U5 tri-snRNP-associated protein 2 [Plasmodium gaboni]KYN96971.1 putative U4/U6.U5 tri-snRNP-associated protein 2 [Plasmodium gaboni]
MERKSKKNSKSEKAESASKKKKKKNDDMSDPEEDEKTINEVEEGSLLRESNTTKSNVNDVNNNNNNNTYYDKQVNNLLYKKRDRVCPYLRTINRNLLDFDFEKLCSISLSNLHVYACLVCGLYFQGIGKGTHAYTHSLEKNHYVFINLETCKTCCIPEGYEIVDASLNDIKYFLKPTYNKEQVEHLCFNSVLGKSLDGGDFLPGLVGLNNLKNTDYCNVIIQLICSIIPIRNTLLLYEYKENIAKNIIVVLSELIKKIYNPRNFKGVVSPHEFLQAVGIESNKNFKIGTKKYPLDFFLWLLNKIYKHSQKILKKRKSSTLKKKTGYLKRKLEDNENVSKEKKIYIHDKEIYNEMNKLDNTSNKKNEQNKWTYSNINIVDYCFDGELIIKTIKEEGNEESQEQENMGVKFNESDNDSKDYLKNINEEEVEEKNKQKNDYKHIYNNTFLNLIKENKNYLIKKIPFRTLSLKLPSAPVFKSTTESNIIPQVSIFELLSKFDGETETFLQENSKTPSTLIISKLPKYLIFTIERFSKNNFFIEKNGTIVNFVIKNLDMKDYVHEDFLSLNPVTKYNLIANIFHTGTVNQGSYKIHVLNQPTNEWYEIEDLHVISILPQLVLLPESCIQLYQRQDVKLNGDI